MGRRAGLEPEWDGGRVAGMVLKEESRVAADRRQQQEAAAATHKAVPGMHRGTLSSQDWAAGRRRGLERVQMR